MAEIRWIVVRSLCRRGCRWRGCRWRGPYRTGLPSYVPPRGRNKSRKIDDHEKSIGIALESELGVAAMTGIYLEIPSGVADAAGSLRLPLEVELKRRLMAAMYADEVVGGSASCMLGNIEREMRHHWLCGCTCVPPNGKEEFARGRRNQGEWLP